MEIKVIIAMHKPYQVPVDDIYVPLHVGACGKANIEIAGKKILTDDNGDNISEKNPNYCELTGLYYAWKNIAADVIGLVHYRRYFTAKKLSYRKRHKPFECVLDNNELSALLKRGDIIVPNKRKYYIESLYSHYCHTLDGMHLDLAREIVEDKYPEYLEYVDKAYNSTSGYMFNMTIMKKQYLDEYCSFIFTVLGVMEGRIDISGLDAFSARLFGRVSEILFNAYILKKRDESVSIVECRTMDMEPVNWLKKIWGFLAAKFFGKKYTKSM